MNYRLILLALLGICIASCKAVQEPLSSKRVGRKPPLFQLTALAVADTSGLFFLQGTVREEKTGEPVLFGAVALYQNDKLLRGVETDFDGNYSFLLDCSDPTMLSIEFSYLGLERVRIEGIEAQNEKFVNLDVELWEDKGIILEHVHFGRCGGLPIIEQDNTTSGRTFTSDEIRRSGVRGN